jgi:hypothetical protein
LCKEVARYSAYLTIIKEARLGLLNEDSDEIDLKLKGDA